ncbi:MAG: hypothetical protein FD180_3004 [Planctomycetota bacterium]|nr:MAG: hypothetical protein FD180_3004 [Planctomycetota bacterium]
MDVFDGQEVNRGASSAFTFIALIAAISITVAEDPKPVPKPRALTDWEKKVVDKINGYRKAAGVKEVSVSVELSNGCQKHADYLVKNYVEQKSEGATGNDEIDARPGYTPEGKKAGAVSDINYIEPLRAVDESMESVFQRAAMLQPDLEKIGIGVACPNKNWYVVIDVKSGLTAESPAPFVVYPGDKQAAVPLQYKPEGRNAIPDDKDARAGYPVTVTFRHLDTVESIKGTLKDVRGKEVPVWLVTPDTIADAKHLKSIAIIAQDPLERSTTYTAWFEAEVNGEKATKTWTFTTGKK